MSMPTSGFKNALFEFDVAYASACTEAVRLKKIALSKIAPIHRQVVLPFSVYILEQIRHSQQSKHALLAFFST
jgi:hypothetical protein